MDAPRLSENVNGNLVEKSSVSSKLIGIFNNGLPHVLIHFENYIIVSVITLKQTRFAERHKQRTSTFKTSCYW